MRALPAVPGRAVIAVLERSGFEMIRTKGSHYFLRHRADPVGKQWCRCISAIYHPARFARYCGKRTLAAPSSSGGSGSGAKLVEQRFCVF